MGITDKDKELILTNCSGNSSSISDKDIVGVLSIEDLLQKGFEKHVGSFEIPASVRDIVEVDEINAIITWYNHWKLTTPADLQNTCTIKDIFGYADAIKVVVAINFYKYLRNKGYDPDIVEKFLIMM